MNERQTVAGAYAKIDAHEDLCAERYKNIHDAIKDVKGWLRWILTGVIGLLISILAWALFQLYSLEPLRAQTSVTVSTSTASAPALPRRAP